MGKAIDVLGDPDLLNALVEAYLTTTQRVGMVVLSSLDEPPAVPIPTPIPRDRGQSPLLQRGKNAQRGKRY